RRRISADRVRSRRVADWRPRLVLCAPSRPRRRRGNLLGKPEAAAEVARNMITKFVTVYPGHIDLPDMGQDTTPANERRYSNEELAGVFEKTEAVAQKMDALGYDTLWLAEHHFQHEGYECIPNILMLAVHLAHVTKRLRIGCGFNIAPMWHPLRLAED